MRWARSHSMFWLSVPVGDSPAPKRGNHALRGPACGNVTRATSWLEASWARFTSLDADGELALRVCARERGERVGGLRKLVRLLDGDAQSAVRQQTGEALQVLGRRCGHDHRPARTFARGSGG